MNAPKSVMRWTLPMYTLSSSGVAVSSWMMLIAFCAAASSDDAMLMRPSSSTSIFTPVRSTMLRMVLPPEPMTSRIFSTGILIVMMRGAKVEMSARAVPSVSAILPRMCMRP